MKRIRFVLALLFLALPSQILAQTSTELESELELFCQWIDEKSDLPTEIQKWGPLDTVAIREALASEVAAQSPRIFNSLLDSLAQRYRITENMALRDQIEKLFNSTQVWIQEELLDDQEHPAKKILDDVVVVALGVYLIGIGKRAFQINRLKIPASLSKAFGFRQASASLGRTASETITRSGWVQLSRAIKETTRSFPKDAARATLWSLPPALGWAAYDAWREKKIDPRLLIQNTHEGIFIEIASRSIENLKNLTALTQEAYLKDPAFWAAFMEQTEIEAQRDLLEIQFLQKQAPLRHGGKISFLSEDLKMVQRKIEALLQMVQSKKSMEIEMEEDQVKSVQTE